MATVNTDLLGIAEGQSLGGDTNIPEFIRAAPYFNELMAIWPDLYNQRTVIAPAGNGMNRFTGRMISGWKCTEQSMDMIFKTPFHERILRRWVGSFVPQILGEEIVPRIVTRFYWAIASAIELWEPRYKIKQINFMGNALAVLAPREFLDAADLIRLGEVIFRHVGSYYPRGHLGDFTPYQRRQYGLAGRGGHIWDKVPIGNS